MDLQVIIPGTTGSSQSLQVSEVVFACDYNEALIHQVVVAEMAGLRQGTLGRKSRSEVQGSTRKPWRQKGFGNARAGTIRSPIWRGGGATFTMKTRDYSQKVNKKMYRGAVRSILSELVRQERLIIVESFTLPEAKTKLLKAQLDAMDITDALIVTADFNEQLFLAARNLPKIDVVTHTEIDPVSLIGYGRVLMTTDALKKIEERLA